MERLLTAKEASKLLRTPEWRINDFIRSGEMWALKDGDEWKVPETSILVKVVDGVAVTDSMQLARAFDENHESVLEVIEHILNCELGDCEAKGGEHFKKDAYPAFTPKRYLLDIDGFNIMRESFNKDTFETGVLKIRRAFDIVNINLLGGGITHPHKHNGDSSKFAKLKKELANEAEAMRMYTDISSPKDDYVDRILREKGFISMEEVAVHYNMDVEDMYHTLERLSVLYVEGEQWLLSKKLRHMSLIIIKECNYIRADGSSGIKVDYEWTQKGRLYLYNLLKEHGYLPRESVSLALYDLIKRFKEVPDPDLSYS